MTRDDKIEKLREHLNRFGDHKSVFVSVDGLQALFGQRDELKAQVERLLAKEGKRIGKELVNKPAPLDIVEDRTTEQKLMDGDL